MENKDIHHRSSGDARVCRQLLVGSSVVLPRIYTAETKLKTCNPIIGNETSGAIENPRKQAAALHMKKTNQLTIIEMYKLLVFLERLALKYGAGLCGFLAHCGGDNAPSTGSSAKMCQKRGRPLPAVNHVVAERVGPVEALLDHFAFEIDVVVEGGGSSLT